jgi:hypothetical protein
MNFLSNTSPKLCASSLIALLTILFQVYAVCGEDDSSIGSGSRFGNATIDVDDDITAIKGVTGTLALIVGLILSFVGYKLFRPTIFVCAFLVGGLLAGGITNEILNHASDGQRSSHESTVWIAFAVGGILFSFWVMCMYNAGVFLVGGIAGMLFGVLISSWVNSTGVVTIVIVVVVGLIGGILAFKLERPVLIIATSYTGAHLIVWGAGQFIGKYHESSDIWWAYTLANIVIFLLAMFIQFHKTANNVDHSK